MTSVSRKDGFRYGFYVFAYWLTLLAFSAALMVAGGWIVGEQLGDVGANQEGALAALGGFVAFLGVLVFGAGQTGLVYKVVADGVATGAENGGAGNWLPSESEMDEEGEPVGVETAENGQEEAAGPGTEPREQASSTAESSVTSAETGTTTAETATEASPDGRESSPGSKEGVDGDQPDSGHGRQSGEATEAEPTSTVSLGGPDSGDEPGPMRAPGVDPEPAGSDDESARSDRDTATDESGDVDTAGPVDDAGDIVEDDDTSDAIDDDAFESGGFEPATTVTDEEPAVDRSTGESDGEESSDETEGDETPDRSDRSPEDSESNPAGSPVDVASESEIAEELGFGDSAAADENRPDIDGQETESAGDSSASTGDDPDPLDPETGDDPDPLAPDSGFASAEATGADDSDTPEDPAEAETRLMDVEPEPADSAETSAGASPDEPATKTGPTDPAVDEGAVDHDDRDAAIGTAERPDESGPEGSPDWTTGEDHMGNPTSPNERDERNERDGRDR